MYDASYRWSTDRPSYTRYTFIFPLRLLKFLFFSFVNINIRCGGDRAITFLHKIWVNEGDRSNFQKVKYVKTELMLQFNKKSQIVIIPKLSISLLSDSILVSNKTKYTFPF